MQNLEGKVAFITGGASGIGLGMVQAFLEQGMKVVIADVREDHLEEAREALKSADVLQILVDVTDRQALANAAAKAQSHFGKIHVLCNNAGIGQISSAFETTYDDWDWNVAVNLTSVFNGLHTFLPLLTAHGEGGHIVNTSSVAAILPGGFAYAATKAGVCALTETMANELAAKEIGVTCLMPGPVKSNIHEVAALRPKQFADTLSTAAEAEMAARETPEHWLEPIIVGRTVVDAIRRNLLFVITHNEFGDGVAERFAAILSAMPEGTPREEDKKRIGFPTSNPIYSAVLQAGAARSAS